jgi:hypothetical protein
MEATTFPAAHRWALTGFAGSGLGSAPLCTLQILQISYTPRVGNPCLTHPCLGHFRGP